MSNFKFKVGDRVVLSEEWLNEYHPDDEKYREVFTLLPNTLGNDITVHIMFEGRYKDVFHSDGYYMESDGFAALLHEGDKTSITQEQLEIALNNLGISYQLVEVDDYGFSRVYKFNLLGLDYYIEWWNNISYLSIASRNLNKKAFERITRGDSHPSFRKAVRFSMLSSKGFYDDLYVAIELNS